jgi:sugar/nucleoside kinase (ribokinase family)
MRTIDLACVGESFEDLIFAGLDRLPLLGEELRTKPFVRTWGGGATITAMAAARLGLTTSIVSALADGAMARLKKEGVRIANLRRRGEAHAVTVALSTPRDRAFVTFDGVNSELGPRFVRALGRVRARIVHCALCPRDIPPLARAFRTLRSRGVKVSLDLGYDLHLAKDRDLRRLISEADYLLINEDEAKLYSGRKTLAQAEAYWRENARETVIKLGPRGSRWISARGIVEERSRARTAVDTTGAGDAFNAGFLAGLLRGLPVRRALRLGNRVGARSILAVGGIDGLPRLVPR